MDYTNIKEKMEKCINVYNEKLSEVRAGRANPAILNKVKIDYYGTPTPINQVAGVSVPEARLIVIQPWDMSILKEIEKAILASDIGINPNNDGKVIRLAFPELTEERRKDLVKDIKKMAEEAKVAVRSVRRDGIETAKEEQKEGSSLSRKVNSIIERDYRGKISLKDIGKELFVNSSYLSRVYKKETGYTVTDAINSYRIEKAKEILETGEYRVCEVGEMVGIEDPAYFTHVFLKYEGKSPSDFMNR